MAQVKRFGDVHKKAAGSKISRLEPIVTDEDVKYVIDKRDAEWDAYKVKAHKMLKFEYDFTRIFKFI